MSKPIVLLDCDGVIGDFLTPAVTLANDLFGTSYDPNDLKTWEMLSLLKLNKEQEHELFEHIKKPGFHSFIRPYPGAQDGVKALRAVADVHVVTSPMHGPTWCSERWDWLYDVFSIRAKDVTHTHAKHLVFGDVIVDDKRTNVALWTKAWARFGGRGVLWAQHYNECDMDIVCDPVIVRTNSWADVIGVVEDLI